MASQPPSKKQKLAAGAAAKSKRTSAPKRSDASPSTSPKRKGKGRSTEDEVADHIAVSRTDSPNCPPDQREWPAPVDSMSAARRFLEDAVTYLTDTSTPVHQRRPLVIVPDKDADGLSAGQILRRTLLHLGVPNELLKLHLMSKGNSPTSREERAKLTEYDAAYIVVLDQGSREGPGVVPASEAGWDEEECRTKAMVLDHHFIEPGKGPRGALMLSAAHHYPIAASALLSWVLCRPLWSSALNPSQPLSHTPSDFLHLHASKAIDYLCLLGTMGDLSVNVEWNPPWPDMSVPIKSIGKSNLSKAISLINAPRRTPEFDALAAWQTLEWSREVADILQLPSARDGGNPALQIDREARSAASTAILRLYEARNAVFEETERATHTPPKFSKDGRIALLRIKSGFQVHPSIATRWSGTLKGAKNLQVVMCANEGYSQRKKRKRDQNDGKEELISMVHFSCRRAKAALDRGEDINIIEILKYYASLDPTFLPDLDNNYEEELEPVAQEETQGADGDGTSSSREGGGSSNFAKGHREASGGIMPAAFFERFVNLMQIGVKPSPPPGDPSPRKSRGKKEQKTNLLQFFQKSPAKADV